MNGIGVNVQPFAEVQYEGISMSNSDVGLASETLKEKLLAEARGQARLKRERAVAEHKFLGHVQVSGWVTSDLANDATTILAALLAGQTEYLPVTVTAREASLAAAEATRHEATQSAEETTRAATADAVWLRAEADNARRDAATATETLAEQRHLLSLADAQRSEIPIKFNAARLVFDRLQQPGLRASLARLILKI